MQESVLIKGLLIFIGLVYNLLHFPRRKNFENRLGFDKVIGHQLVVYFVGHNVHTKSLIKACNQDYLVSELFRGSVGSIKSRVCFFSSSTVSHAQVVGTKICK